jgi:hypothetical protein
MTTESEQQEQQAAIDQAAQEAAFSAGFTGEPISTPAPTPEPTREPTPAPTPEPVKNETEDDKEQEAAQPAPTPAPTPAPFDAQAEIRRLQGQYGALHDLLKQSLKTKEAEGKPATLTPVELKRMKEQFPEMNEYIQADIAEVLAGMAPKAPDPKELDTLVSQRVQREMASIREAAVTDRHENWKTDLWVDGKLGESRTPDYAAWLKTMSEAEASAFENSANPYDVAKKLDAFYEWKNKANQKQTEKQDRLKKAVTPQGVPRAGQSTLSEEELMEKGFSEGFNS